MAMAREVHANEMDEGLTSLDSQRILSILNEVERKIHVLNLLPLVVEKKVHSIFAIDTVSLITEFRQLESKLIATTDAAEKEDLNNKLKKITRAVYRHFLMDPGALTKLRALSLKMEKGQETFELYVSQFKRIIYDRLKISVEQEQKKQEALEQITTAEKKTRDEIQQKRTELKQLREERNNMNMKKVDQITALKDELRSIRMAAEEANKKLEMKASTKQNSEKGAADEKKKQLSEELEKLELHYQQLVTRNRDDEAQARRKRAKAESEVEHWIIKYDTDMGEKQTELDELQLIYNDEHSQLDELRSRFQVLKDKEAIILVEKQAEEEIKRKLEAEQERLSKAATRIQAMYRGWILRKKLKKQKDKKGAAAPPPKKGK